MNQKLATTQHKYYIQPRHEKGLEATIYADPECSQRIGCVFLTNGQRIISHWFYQVAWEIPVLTDCSSREQAIDMLMEAWKKSGKSVYRDSVPFRGRSEMVSRKSID